MISQAATVARGGRSSSSQDDRKKCSHPGKRGNSIPGFTLIEIIVVLVVIGITGAIVGSRSIGTNPIQARSEADVLKANLRQTQLRAMSDADTTMGVNTNTWGVAFSAGSYTLQRNGATASATFPNEATATHTFPSGTSLTSGAGTTVTYDVWGSPGTNAITLTLTSGTSSQTITITRNTGFIQ